MLNLTKNKKKLIIQAIVLVIALILIGVIFYKVYYMETNIDENLLNEYKLKEAGIDKKFDKLNTEFFDNEKYKSLKDSKVEKINIDDLDVGKENPFEIPKDTTEEDLQE